MNSCKQIRKPSGITLLGIALGCGFALALCPFSAAQDFEELEDAVATFQETAKEVYRFNDEAMQAILEAYCGLLDEDSEEYNRDFAAEIGLNYQQQQEDKWEVAIGQVSPLMAALEPFQDNPESEDKADELLDIIMKEEGTLRQLQDNVVLRGANHPFVQFAINYGVQKHKDLCSLGESPKICDKTWPTLGDRRPDLVYVDSSGLWVLEFKPNNERAISEGEKQASDYVNSIEAYFQNFFPGGREGGYQSSPDSDHGGEEIVKKLLATDEAWTSNDEAIEAVGKVVTYDRCEEP